MLDAWLNRTQDWLKVPEKLLPLPEQEFARWTLNRVARQSRQAPLTCQSVFLWGEAGSGKSALIRQELRAQSPLRRRSTIIAAAVEWLAWLSDDLQLNEMLSLESHADLLVCEDLQNATPDAGDTDRLASWLDQAAERRVPVLITADRLPSQIPHLSPRLVDRLQGGLLTGIRPLCGSSKQRLGAFWSKEGIAPAQNPVAKLWNDPTLITAGQLHSRLLARNASATVSDSRRNSRALVLVAEVVSRDFHLSIDDLRSGARRRTLQIPRDVAMSLARELTTYPLAAIGQYFGCQSHTSVGRSTARLQQLLIDAPTLRQQVQSLRAELRQELSADCG